MSRLTRFLDQSYDEGLRDGRLVRPHNPGVPEYAPRYFRWAYNAGHSAGTDELNEMRAAVARDAEANEAADRDSVVEWT